MKVVGYIATGIVALAVVTGVVVIIMSLPDIRRYARIRKM
jgi:hypothetical protein